MTLQETFKKLAVVWKPVPFGQFSLVYKVSNTGLVKSIDRTLSNGRFVKGKILKQYKNPKGYMRISLSLGDTKKKFMVHRLVLVAFAGHPINSSLQVNHIDRNPSNNNLSNLEWVTASQNVRHSLNNGLQRPRGEQNPCSKLRDRDIREIRKMAKQGIKNVEIARVFNVDKSNIGLILKGKAWKHVA